MLKNVLVNLGVSLVVGCVTVLTQQLVTNAVQNVLAKNQNNVTVPNENVEPEMINADSADINEE